MQTFLPYANFWDSARVLDYRRLGKQRVEAYQILKVLKGETTAWANHPAVKMWSGYSDALSNYLHVMITTWIGCGYKNTMDIPTFKEDCEYPFWLGNEDFHASHRSNLLRKNFEFYSQYKWKESPNLEYIWPVR